MKGGSISGKVATGSDSTNKYSIEGFVGSEGPIKYTNKTNVAQNIVRQPPAPPADQHPNIGADGAHNMDSLEPDSVQASTSKQLSRMNNNQIQHTLP